MHVSICTGTYNRLAYLQRMIESARANIPLGIQHQFLVVDGGSTDNTPEWCKAQPDIDFLQHGELRGAIKAFSQAAREAQGDFCLLANDDVTFHHYSIMKAVHHLETHHNCGAVAFADNRTALVSGGGTHRVEQIAAIGLDGNFTMVPYGQVALYRTWLGNEAGWWGDQDIVMSKARTYGGDTYLSSRIWSMGYTVDAVDGCMIDDSIASDDLRTRNGQTGHQDSQLYYTRFPKGPRLQAYPTIPNHQRERLRVLLMDIHEPALPARTAKEKGLMHALARVGLVWQIDYVNESYDLRKAMEVWQPHILIIQMQDTDKLNAHTINEARAASPHTLVVNFNGDVYEDRLISPAMLEALKQIDLQTTVNAKVLPVYQQAGIPSAYWQIGFKPAGEPYLSSVPEYEVLALFNCYNSDRHVLASRLQALPYKVGLYGNCPGAVGNTHYAFAQSAALYQNCKIAIGDTYPNALGYVSNRLFQALGNGAFLLQQESEGLEQYTGIKAGVHFAQWTDLDDLEDKIKYWLDPKQDKTRAKIAAAGQRFVLDNFTYHAQVSKLWQLI